MDAQYAKVESQYVDRGKPVGAVEDLDGELNSFDDALERLEKLLGPVMSQYATADRLSEPQSEPATQLRGRTQRLRVQLRRLETIMDQVDL